MPERFSNTERLSENKTTQGSVATNASVSR